MMETHKEFDTKFQEFLCEWNKFVHLKPTTDEFWCTMRTISLKLDSMLCDYMRLPQEFRLQDDLYFVTLSKIKMKLNG